MHLNVEYSNGNGRPRGKGPDFDSEYVHALRIGDKRKIKMCLDKNTYRTECEVETEIERSARKRGRQLSSCQRDRFADRFFLRSNFFARSVVVKFSGGCVEMTAPIARAYCILSLHGGTILLKSGIDSRFEKK